MRSIIELKKEILFNREMTDLIDILKKTAVSQFQSLLNRRKNLTAQERYLNLLEGFFKQIDFSRGRHPLFKGAPHNIMVVLVTSDMGFLGGLNSDILETARKTVTRKDIPKWFVVGDKGRDYLVEINKDFAFMEGITDEIAPVEADRIAQYIFVTAIREKISRVVMVYPKFFSFAHQEIDTFQLLPPPQRPDKGDFGRVLYEPFEDKVIDYLIRKWLTHRIYDILMNSKLSEFAARANHLEGSTRELQDMKKAIEFQYFRTKHEITDRTIRDIFGGRLATLRKKKANPVPPGGRLN